MRDCMSDSSQPLDGSPQKPATCASAPDEIWAPETWTIVGRSYMPDSWKSVDDMNMDAWCNATSAHSQVCKGPALYNSGVVVCPGEVLHR